MAPNVEILIRTFVVLVGLDPSESMLGWLLHLINNDCNNINVISIASLFWSFL
jgi:hypothetical protein